MCVKNCFRRVVWTSFVGLLMLSTNGVFAEEWMTADFSDVRIAVPRSWRILDQETVRDIAEHAKTFHNSQDRLFVAKAQDNSALVRLSRRPKDPELPALIRSLKYQSAQEREETKQLQAAKLKGQVVVTRVDGVSAATVGLQRSPSLLQSYERAGVVNPSARWHVRIFALPGKHTDYLLSISYDQANPQGKAITDRILDSFDVKP